MEAKSSQKKAKFKESKIQTNETVLYLDLFDQHETHIHSATTQVFS